MNLEMLRSTCITTRFRNKHEDLPMTSYTRNLCLHVRPALDGPDGTRRSRVSDCCVAGFRK